jgi:formylglycine-generating enzyme required for sulfatase activity
MTYATKQRSISVIILLFLLSNLIMAQNKEVISKCKTLDYDLIKVIPGTFTMGSSEGEAKRDKDERPHKVSITKEYFLGKYEVTQEQYEKIMAKNPSKFKGPKKPVEQIEWKDAVEFCVKLTEIERNKKHISSSQHYRLPTEAEWEYACRAGSSTPYSGDLKKMGWYKDNSGKVTHNIGEKEANPWGFYDMNGNVWEWCHDWFGPYEDNAVDPVGPDKETYKTFRGGSCKSTDRGCRSGNRYSHKRSKRMYFIGLRIVLSSNKK